MIISTRGELIWLDSDPQACHEQVGRRPAVVLSEAELRIISSQVAFQF
ncbi:type II toxin-antitoxin system PemK/MazF family toxin [Paenibacillus eucommiae]|uniref:mRNA-degrading endonuclease toxin of MazEF toxin-antitoxin module n=1 Tax=Paenibacillus eucommiae TaxID=1355755 RepID=A0ABS4IWQ3_9BACL|nr:type II toxin-antitoxin system PemK/MazF family toxin [Paenibacillus eucommiae]MBP1991510.1 mRNA-degrading endonuclease toxin of MazEF toxin-antitoxin module [Paenibacillus eucommiae]